MNARVRNSSNENEYQIFDDPLAGPTSGAAPKKLEPSFKFAHWSKAEQRNYINKDLRKKQVQEQSDSLNYPYTLMNYTYHNVQKLIRRQKSDGQIKGKIESADIIVSDDQSTEENSEKIVLSEEEFKELRKLYHASVNLVNFKYCSATRASVTRGLHTIKPNTIVTGDDKKTFNANRIDEIKLKDGEITYEISLIASMGVNPKKKHAVPFFKWVKRETDRKEDGTPGRQVILVNLTEDREKLSYMPQNEQGIVELGSSAKSYSCFNPGDSDPNEPYSLSRLWINKERGLEMAPVEKDEEGDSFCKIQIRNKEGESINGKAITSVSFKVKDHYPIKKLKKRIEKLKELIKKDPSTQEKTLVVSCNAGMGRTSLVSIAMKIASEVEEGTNKTAEELLIDNVWKFCAARRFFAVNEPGFMTLYCYTRELLKERDANRSEKLQPQTYQVDENSEAFIFIKELLNASSFDEVAFKEKLLFDENLLNTILFGEISTKDAQLLTEEELNESARPPSALEEKVGRSKSGKFKQWFVKPRQFKFNRKKKTSSTAPSVMDHAASPETVSLANEPKKRRARLPKLFRSSKKKISSTTPPVTSQVVSPETAALANKSNKRSAILSKLRRSSKKKTSSTAPPVTNQVVSPETAPPASNLNDDTISSAASTKSHSSNAEESQEGQPSKLSEKSIVSALRKKFIPKEGTKGSKAPEYPTPTDNWRLANGV